MTDIATVSKKDLHLAACAAAKVEGDARRATKKADRATAHRAFLDGRIAEGQARKADRVAGHEARNADTKAAAIAKKASNDDQADVDQAA